MFRDNNGESKPNGLEHQASASANAKLTRHDKGHDKSISLMPNCKIRWRRTFTIILFAWLIMNTDPAYPQRALRSMITSRMLRQMLTPITAFGGDYRSPGSGGMNAVEAVALIHAMNSNNNRAQHHMDNPLFLAQSGLIGGIGGGLRGGIARGIESMVGPDTRIANRQLPVPVPLPVPFPGLNPIAAVAAALAALAAALAAGLSPIAAVAALLAAALLAAFLNILLALVFLGKLQKSLVKKLVIKKTVLPFVIPIPYKKKEKEKEKEKEVIIKYIPKETHHHHGHSHSHSHEHEQDHEHGHRSDDTSDNIKKDYTDKRDLYKKQIDQLKYDIRSRSNSLNALKSLVSEQDRLQHVVDTVLANGHPLADSETLKRRSGATPKNRRREQ